MAGLWLALAFTAGKSIAATLWSAINAPFRGQTGGATTYKHVAITFARSFFGSASIEQVQYILPPKSARNAYEALMHCQKATPNIVRLHDGTEAFWIGNPNAGKLIIYLPGGAYCIPALPGHFDLVNALAADLKKSNQDLAQGVALVQYAIEVLGKRPSNIILQGDSSGAHLTLAILSHLTEGHLHDSTPSLSLSENLRGALLLSPWIDFSTDHESFRTNADKDAISAKSLSLWAQALFRNTEIDIYSHPTEAPVGWWRLLPVERIFIGVGGDEVLLDPIISLGDKIEAEPPDVLISRVPREFHAEPITDFGLKIAPGVQFQAMAAWLNQTFSR
ncbi:esterase [Aspergillus bombycis]|uniref:Esterase n=1 Tax=Aspergillus bombycis TaxID=109264 RepID=A0A1F7ZZZ1_9EURO|nr:esterase [Aspergillus bombycis]OGM45030.1 esterase [Aspergillus bombycis]